jgi:hypothetical protein
MGNVDLKSYLYQTTMSLNYYIPKDNWTLNIKVVRAVTDHAQISAILKHAESASLYVEHIRHFRTLRRGWKVEGVFSVKDFLSTFDSKYSKVGTF